MSADKFEIQLLGNPTSTFTAGQTIHDELLIVNSKELKSTGIKIHIRGKTVVKWREGHESYSARQDHIRNSIWISADRHQKSDIVINPGAHLIPFKFILRHDLPSSFDGKYGKIGYKLEAVIERGWKADLKAKLDFKVNGVLDLNTIPAAIQQVEKRKSKSLWCFWCKSGPVTFVLRLPKSGFVPGENVNFVLELANYSKKPVTKVSVRIMQLITYYAKKRVQLSLSRLCSTVGPAVPIGETEIWRGQDLQIPSSALPSTPTCSNMIDISYVLRVEMHIAGLSWNLISSVPIFIGTVPVTSTSPTRSPELL